MDQISWLSVAKAVRSHIAPMLELQLDQAVEKAQTLKNRRSSKGRVVGSLGRDILLFLLHLQDCECEEQEGMTSPGLFRLWFSFWVGLPEDTKTAEELGFSWL